MYRFTFMLYVCMSVSLLSGGLLHSQTATNVTYKRTVIPRPRSSPRLHYWTGIDDQNRGVVVLMPTDASPTSPGPNGFGVVVIDSEGFSSHPDSYWIGDQRLERFQPFLRRGYTVFIVTHPPSAFPLADSNQPRQPGYITAEIREFLELSVLSLKNSAEARTSIGDNLNPDGWADQKFYGVVGGSSGANLGLYLALTQPQDRKTLSTTGSGGSQVTVDTGFGAMAGGSAGVDAHNWRAPGDESAVWRNAQGLAHADLTLPPYSLAFPPPSTLPLPSHRAPADQFVFPTDLSPVEDAIDGKPWSNFMPEIYLLPLGSTLPFNLASSQIEQQFFCNFARAGQSCTMFK